MERELGLLCYTLSDCDRLFIVSFLLLLVSFVAPCSVIEVKSAYFRDDLKIGYSFKHIFSAKICL